MADWSKSDPVDFTAGGDTTSEAIGKFISELTSVYTLLNRVRKLDYGASAPTDPVTGHGWIDTSGAVPTLKYYDGDSWEAISVTLATNPKVNVRNCVLGCRVNGTTGVPNWVGAGTGLKAQVYATDTNVTLAFAGGFGTDGTVDYIAVITEDLNPAWEGLPESGTAYLYVDRNTSTGALTYGHSVVAPVYSTTTPTPETDMHWWNPATGIMQRYTGTAWETKQRIFVGVAVTNATTITSLTVYPVQDEHYEDLVTSGLTATTATIGTLTATALTGARPYVKVTHTTAASTHGGTATSGAWHPVPINTEDVDAGSNCALSDFEDGDGYTHNYITLTSGTWRVVGWASFYSCAFAMARLVKVSDPLGTPVTTTLFNGNLAAMDADDAGISRFEGQFTVTNDESTTEVVDLQYRVSSSQTSNGLGYGSSWVDANVFACLEFYREV